jgi:hypothetical protein
MRFPILFQSGGRDYAYLRRAPGSLPWAMIEEHAQQCEKNHGQSVARLAERGGLDPWEACAVLEDKDVGLLVRVAAPDIVDRLWAHHDAWVLGHG